MITAGLLRSVLGWCSLINMGLLLWWFLIITLAHDWIYQFHTKWFKLSKEKFDAIHYQGITFFKILVFVFNVVPYLALRIVG